MKFTFLSFLFFLMSISTANTTADTIYEFKPTNINGKETSLNKYKGKTLLIVNTASECGYTPQYEGLQSLHEKHSDEDFKVLGFPANNFGGQEPGTDEQIKQFCKVNFEVSFPMFSKVSVKGDNQHPLFKYLTTSDNPDFTGAINWNFEKFLIGKDGELLRRFRSDVTPQSDEVTGAIQKALNS